MNTNVSPDLIAPRQSSRRGVIAAGAWSAPVIVMSIAAPAFAVSTSVELSFRVPPTPVGVGEYSSDGIVLVRADGHPASDRSILIQLAPGLSWRDGTRLERTLTTSDGEVALAGVNAVTASAAGTYAITAVDELTGRTAVAELSVVVAAVPASGQLHWSLNGSAAAAIVAAPTPIVEAAVGVSAIHVRSVDNRWYRWNWGGKAWDSFTTPDSVDAVYVNEGGNYGWALSNGSAYVADPGRTPRSVGGDASGLVQLAVGTSSVYGRSRSGGWSRHVWSATGSKPWTSISAPGPAEKIFVNESGNHGWAIIGGQVYWSYAGSAAAAVPALPDRVVDLAVGATYVYALTEIGAWYVLPWSSKTWSLLAPSGLAAISSNESAGYGWGIRTDGRVVWVNSGAKVVNLTDPLPSGVAKLGVGLSRVHALTNDGKWYQLAWPATAWTATPGAPETVMWVGVNEGGNYGWALS
ncbi:hypothetical protein ACPPVW_03000 [Leifsonia sp. McL0607]|uniref:hypothetical protein n=1 Tax=Leifsonia sp. McL0607 TaxID=3415672 RepID=UPI003CF8FE3A